MTTFEFFKAIQGSDFSRYIGAQNHLFGAFYQLIHIVGLVMVLSSIILLSLRILGGGGGRQQSLIEITQATSHLIWVGLALLVLSGALIFVPASTNYYPNSVFWGKFILLAVALLAYWLLSKANAQSREQASIFTKTIAILNLLLWFSVAFAGRFIGFV